jgi:hypothetical protein
MKTSATLLCLLFFFTLTSQAQTKHYTSASGEMIFSFAKIKRNGSEVGSNLRWSPVFNFQVLRNHDFTNTFGIFHGLAMRNVGFIYDVPGTDTLKKFRTYNIGIPLGFKIGNLDNGFFLYGGYEFEIPFNYKEKTFVGERKTDKFSVWFSDRTDWWTQSVYVGLNFPRGFNLKFKYYLNNFFNKSFSEDGAGGVRVQPFANMDVNVFYIALDWNVFRDVHAYSKKRQPKQNPNQSNTNYSFRY